MKKMVLIILSIFLIFGCEEENPIGNLPPIDITVTSQDGEPVAGATISGGIDWDAYRVQTNEFGEATIPGRASGGRATIYKTNYHPTTIFSVIPAPFILEKTEKRLDPIGSVLGKSISFKKDEIITLDYGGTYRVYSYSDDLVTEIYSQSLGELATAIKDIGRYSLVYNSRLRCFCFFNSKFYLSSASNLYSNTRISWTICSKRFNFSAW